MTSILQHLKTQVKHQDAIDARQKDIKIVYTPLTWNRKYSGTEEFLRELGFENVYVVTGTG